MLSKPLIAGTSRKGLIAGTSREGLIAGTSRKELMRLDPSKLIIRQCATGGAVFDRSMQHRYLLWRSLVDSNSELTDTESELVDTEYGANVTDRTICFVMLNPNRADELSNDPTIKRCIGFARRWGFFKIMVVNLFSIKCATPALLMRLKEPRVAPLNDVFVQSAIAQSSMVVAAWGNHGSLEGRDRDILALIQNVPLCGTSHSGAPHCLGLTKLRQPKHPLYLRADIDPVRFFV